MAGKRKTKNANKGVDKKEEKDEDIPQKRKLSEDEKESKDLDQPVKAVKVDEVENEPLLTSNSSDSANSSKKNWIVGSAKPRVSENIIPNIKINGPVVPDDKWHDIDDLYYYCPVGCNLKSPVLYAFDFDSTLFDYKTDNLSFPHVIDKLKEMNDKGYSLAIISNQAGVPAGSVTIPQMEKRFEKFLNLLPFPMPILACISKHSIFRKPCLGMFQFYCNFLHSEVPVEIDKSYYCGDAAGRDACIYIYSNYIFFLVGKRKKDFSPGDYLFAQNIGCNFITPDAFFEDSKNKIDLDPGMWNNKITDPIKFDDASVVVPDIKLSDKQEMIVLVGPPASGKSTIVNVFKDYERINQDTLKTKSKCINACKSALSSGKSVIIDNTNKDIAVFIYILIFLFIYYLYRIELNGLI